MISQTLKEFFRSIWINVFFAVFFGAFFMYYICLPLTPARIIIASLDAVFFGIETWRIFDYFKKKKEIKQNKQ